MHNEELVLAEEFCTHYNIGPSFITTLRQYNLIDIVSIENDQYIHQDQLQKLEQLVRLHYDLQINLEGIDAITHLLSRVQSLQIEVAMLKARLNVYEDV